jgi:hypothetical protein
MDKNLCRRTAPPPTHRPGVEELRAEPRGCLCPVECAEIAAELETVITALKEQDRAAEENKPPV